MMIQSQKIFSYLFLLIPFFLITGPAIPDIIVTISMIFCISYLIFNKDYKKLINLNFFKISILFWLALIFISFFSYNKINSFQDSIIFIRFLLIPICAYFILFNKEKIFNKLLLFILILVIFVCVDTIYQFFNYSSEEGFGSDLFGFKSNWYGRLTGPFGDELIPGSYVSKFGLIGFVFFISNKRFKYKSSLQSFYLSLILLITFVSGERMAFASFGMGLLALFIFLSGYRKTISLSIFIGSLLIFFVVYLHPFYNDFKVLESTAYHQGLKIEKTFDCKDGSSKICTKIINIQPSFMEVIKNFEASAYGEIYSLSFKMFLDNPITGIGINNYNFLCKNSEVYNELMVNYDCASHPHNIYIQWLTEGGLIIFCLFIVYLIFLILFIINNIGEYKYKVLSLVIILIMFWPVMSTGSLIKNWYGINVFFILGICMCLSKFREN